MGKKSLNVILISFIVLAFIVVYSVSVSSLSKPGSLSINALSSNQIKIQWNDVTNETSYKIERSLSSSSGFNQIGSVGENITSFTDASLNSNTTYYYRIRASNSASDSDYSDVVDIKTLIGTTTTTSYSDVSNENVASIWYTWSLPI